MFAVVYLKEIGCTNLTKPNRKECILNLGMKSFQRYFFMIDKIKLKFIKIFQKVCKIQNN